jgi:hypothetical protein
VTVPWVGVVPVVSDTVAGLALIVCGVGIAWSARTFIEVRADAHRAMREDWARRHTRPPPWWVAWRWPVDPRLDAAFGYAMSVAAIVAGIVLLA